MAIGLIGGAVLVIALVAWHARPRDPLTGFYEELRRNRRDRG